MSYKIIIDVEPADNGFEVSVIVSDTERSFFEIGGILQGQAEVLNEKLLAAAESHPELMSKLTAKNAFQTFTWRDFVKTTFK